MATIPALTTSYYTRANVPLFDYSANAKDLDRYRLWLLKAFLMGQVTVGEEAGTRTPQSLWTCVGSSDGVTAAFDGVDRWGAVYNPTKLVLRTQDGAGENRSWVVLGNANLKMQVLLTLENPYSWPWGYNGNNWNLGPYNFRACFTGAAGFGNGFNSDTPSTTSSPQVQTPSVGADVFGFTANMFGFIDNTASTQHYLHFVVDADGYFYFLGNRVNTGNAYFFMALWKGLNSVAQDTRNSWLIFSGRTEDIGAPHGERIGAQRKLSQTTYSTYGGLLYPWFRGCDNTAFMYEYRRDKFGNFMVMPIPTMALQQETLYSGELRDMYWASYGNNFQLYPVSGSPTNIRMGHMLLPWNTIIPIS